MKNKGFTLVELIGVLLVLGIVSLVVFPAITNSIRNINEKNNDAVREEIISVAKDYVYDNMNDFVKVEDRSYCICIYDKLIRNGLISEEIFENKDLPYKKNDFVLVKYKNGQYDYEIEKNTTSGMCSSDTCKINNP